MGVPATRTGLTLPIACDTDATLGDEYVRLDQIQGSQTGTTRPLTPARLYVLNQTTGGAGAQAAFTLPFLMQLGDSLIVRAAGTFEGNANTGKNVSITINATGVVGYVSTTSLPGFGNSKFWELSANFTRQSGTLNNLRILTNYIANDQDGANLEGETANTDSTSVAVTSACVVRLYNASSTPTDATTYIFTVDFIPAPVA